MEGVVAAAIEAVVVPVFGRFGLGPVIAGLMVFVVGWVIFSMVLGRRD